MSKLTEKYQQQLRTLNLNDEQAEQLIGALTHIVERILEKAYLIRGDDGD